jgi:hypothetical protein
VRVGDESRGSVTVKRELASKGRDHVQWNWLIPLDYRRQDNINVVHVEMSRCETIVVAIFGSDVESYVLKGQGIYQL